MQNLHAIRKSKGGKDIKGSLLTTANECREQNFTPVELPGMQKYGPGLLPRLQAQKGRCFGDAEAYIKANYYQHRTEQERHTPAHTLKSFTGIQILEEQD